MVCPNLPPSELVNSFKKEVLSHYESSLNNKTSPFLSSILILESGKRDKWRALKSLSSLNLYFADSIHAVIRSGFYQNFILFGLTEENSYISRTDLESILNKRSKNTVTVFEYYKLREMKSEYLRNHLSEIESDYRISHSVNHICKKLNNLSYQDPNLNSLRNIESFNNIKKELEIYLKSKTQLPRIKPEQILNKAVSLIRSQ